MLDSGKGSLFCSPGGKKQHKTGVLLHCLPKMMDFQKLTSVILTKLSSILMSASYSCSPSCHLGCVEELSPAGSGTRGRALYFPGSSITTLSGPPALASVRTYKTEVWREYTRKTSGSKIQMDNKMGIRWHTKQQIHMNICKTCRKKKNKDEI